MTEEVGQPRFRLPEPLLEAVPLALADLQRPTPVPIALMSYEADGEQADFGVMTVQFADEGGVSFGLHLGGTRAEVVVEVADRLQEVFLETTAAWAETRPPCPGHSHPAAADAVDGVACWVCPSDGSVVAHIGQADIG